MGSMLNTSAVDKLFVGMANGADMTAAIAQGATDPAAKAAMAVMFHGYPWHAAVCGDLDLTGYRKPESYYRDILWNGDRVYATVRFPEPEGKKIIAVGGRRCLRLAARRISWARNKRFPDPRGALGHRRPDWQREAHPYSSGSGVGETCRG